MHVASGNAQQSHMLLNSFVPKALHGSDYALFVLRTAELFRVLSEQSTQN